MVLTVNLPPHVQSWITRQVSEGRYPTEAAAITAAVEQAIETGYRWEEDDELLASIAEADRGEGEEYTPELRRRLREQAEENLRLGVPVPHDVTY